MAIPQHKIELEQAIRINFKKLIREIESIPVELIHDKDLNGHAKGTYMSIHNLLSYLVGWGQLVLSWHKKKQLGNTVSFPEEGYKWNQLGALAQKFYNDYSHLNFTELIGLFNSTNHDILKLIDETTNDELYAVAWYQQWTLGRMIQLNTSSPYQNALIRIKRWKKNKKIV